jgi:hypothetical protein
MSDKSKNYRKIDDSMEQIAREPVLKHVNLGFNSFGIKTAFILSQSAVDSSLPAIKYKQFAFRFR